MLTMELRSSRCITLKIISILLPLLCLHYSTFLVYAVAQHTSLTNDAKTFTSRLEEERASTRRMEQAARRATEDRDSLQSSVDIKARELDRLHGASFFGGRGGIICGQCKRSGAFIERVCTHTHTHTSFPSLPTLISCRGAPITQLSLE